MHPQIFLKQFSVERCADRGIVGVAGLQGETGLKYTSLR